MKLYRSHGRGLLDVLEFNTMLEEGYIRMRTHPTLPLRIYNYTEKAAYESVWNETTRTCRGLIVDHNDNVVARPFPKFMNLGQTGAAEIGLNEPVEVTDKMDGSLGIIYPTPDGPAVATRGSFVSDQALHATEVLRNRYPDFQTFDWTLTHLVEIVYPENRIVLNYGDQDDLVLLGAVSIEHGYIVGPNTYLQWDGPRTKVFEYKTLQEALEAPIRANAEGLVVRVQDTNRMVKIKQEDYVALHRIVTGMNERTVWEAMAKDEYLSLLAKVPDEFYGWMTATASKFLREHSVIRDNVHNCYYEVLDSLEDNEDFTRKDFALAVQALVPGEYRPFMFTIADGRSIDEMVWQKIRPVGNTASMKQISEDVA